LLEEIDGDGDGLSGAREEAAAVIAIRSRS